MPQTIKLRETSKVGCTAEAKLGLLTRFPASLVDGPP